jgi:hypothetical protein
MRFWYFKPISLAQQGQPRPSAAKSAGSEGCLVTNRCAMPRTFARTQFSTRPRAWFLTIGVVTKSFQFLGQAQHPRLFCRGCYCCFGSAGGLAAGAVVSPGAVFLVFVLVLASVFDFAFFFGVVGSAAGA